VSDDGMTERAERLEAKNGRGINEVLFVHLL
jgi:hypothetical protein